MLRSVTIQNQKNVSMKDNLFKIILRIIAYDIIFLVLLRLAVIFIPHVEQPIIYYINLNFHFIIASLAWMNYRQSKVNREIVLIFCIYYSAYLSIVLLYIFTYTIFSELHYYILYNIAYIYSLTYQLFITFYVFFLSLSPYKEKRNYINLSIPTTLIISAVLYTPIFITGDYISIGYPAVFQRSYYLSLINFSLLVVFWHQYTQSKLIFSEYLSSILSVYTVSIGLAILHAFSLENSIIFEYFAQYFESILFLIFTILWILRLNYLNEPESEENENYIQNYYMLHGFIEKPRKGLLVTFYSGINKTALIIGILVLIFLGVYLFFYNKFEVFIRLNILILIIALIISAILAIVTWHKRWYDAMGFLFKKQK